MTSRGGLTARRILLAGPVFSREVVTVPRRARLYVFRTAYVAALLVLLTTAWQVLAGTQVVRNLGDLARFGGMVFQVLAPLQLTVAVFFAALSAASSVALEKDRRTLILLLLTRLTNAELVLGKLLASILAVITLVVAALPLFMAIVLLGGVAVDQVLAVLGVTLAGAVLAGSLGTTLGFWREKTFQTLAMTALVLVFWTAGWEAVARGVAGAAVAGIDCATMAALFSPWHAILQATRPFAEADPTLGWLRTPVNAFLLVATLLAVALNGVTMALVRVWNPSRELRRTAAESREGVAARQATAVERTPTHWHWKRTSDAATETDATAEAPRPAIVSRRVWDNPILWREVRTWAYGRKILLVRSAYWLLFVLAAVGVQLILSQATALATAELIAPVAPLMVISLLLMNAQAVTALTSERDTRALDLLLVTDLTPKEFVFGKLAGALFNTKEMVLLPLVLCIYLWYRHALSTENLVYLTGGWLIMTLFVATLGVHAGMTYANSRLAISVSLGTLFFLFLGVATSMRIMVAFSGSFQAQLQPFLASMVGGGIGLYVALGYRNPSPAIAVASALLPVATFYALTAFLLDSTLAVFLVVVAAYGFTTAAMLIPAIYEFDVATGRTADD